MLVDCDLVQQGTVVPGPVAQFDLGHVVQHRGVHLDLVLVWFFSYDSLLVGGGDWFLVTRLVRAVGDDLLLDELFQKALELTQALVEPLFDCLLQAGIATVAVSTRTHLLQTNLCGSAQDPPGAHLLLLFKTFAFTFLLLLAFSFFSLEAFFLLPGLALDDDAVVHLFERTFDFQVGQTPLGLPLDLDQVVQPVFVEYLVQ